MSVEKKLLERWVKIIVFPDYYPLREETVTFLAQPDQEQEVYAKGYAEAMRQQVYEAFEAGRKSALSNDWDKERDVMSEAWYLPDSNQEPVAVVGSVFSLLWINRGHHRVSVGDFLYTSPPTKQEPLSDEHLISAAPELLEALENWINALDDPSEWMKCRDDAKKAIEKAHGIGVDDEQ